MDDLLFEIEDDLEDLEPTGLLSKNGDLPTRGGFLVVGTPCEPPSETNGFVDELAEMEREYRMHGRPPVIFEEEAFLSMA